MERSSLEPEPGFVNHINYFVSDVKRVLPFYDALFEALGLTPATPRSSLATYVRRSAAGVRVDWFNLYEDASAIASNIRIAFRAHSRGHVDIVRARISAFAANIEGPEGIEAYDTSWYSIRFEDPLGNRFEVCHCAVLR